MGRILSSIEHKIVKISISLPNELVRYIDERVVNRSQLIESLLSAWQKKQQQQAMLSACLEPEHTLPKLLLSQTQLELHQSPLSELEPQTKED